MTHNASPLVRALARIVVGDLEETVATATPASWREALAMVLTYAKDSSWATASRPPAVSTRRCSAPCAPSTSPR